MSGESEVLVDGIIALPGIAIAGAGYLAYKIGSAVADGVSALRDYHSRKSSEREMVLNETRGELREVLSSLNDVSSAFNSNYENAIRQTASNISRISENFSSEAAKLNVENISQFQNRVRSVSKEMSKKIESDFSDIHKNYESVTADKIKEFKKEIRNTFKSQAEEIAGLSNNLAAKEKYCQGKALEAIENTKNQLDYINKNTDNNSQSTGKIKILEMAYNDMLSQYNRGMYEASYAMAENIKNTALDVFYEMALEKNEIENYKTMLFFELKKLSHLVEENSDIEFEYDERKIKATIYDYSEGLIEGYKKSLDDYYNRTEKSSSLKELKIIYDELVNEMTPSFINIWNWSAKNLENSYIRKDIGMTIVDTLEEQNFTMLESGYKGDRDTNDFYIKFRHNITKEEILIILKPDDKPKRVETAFEIHQLTDNINPDRQEEIRLDIVKGVSEYYETRNLGVKPCVEKSVGTASRMQNVKISDIKNTEQKRSPMI